MKSRVFIISLLALCSLFCALRNIEAQVPQGFNYQAIARDGTTGNPIINTTLKVKLSILSDTTGFYGGTGGTYIWEEEHSNVITNSFGMFTVVLGSPAATKIQGSATSFSTIDWSPANLYVGTKIAQAPSYLYKVMGSAKIWSVPYSLVADEISGSVKKLTVAGETSNMEEPLFEVKNKYGRTVFAVYNEGVRAYVSDGDAKGVKGGFAIGSFDATKGERDLFVVTTDSIRAYIYDDPLNKGVKGGFAIGGFDPTKSIPKDYLLVSPDSVRIYLDQSTGKAVKKGGFAIGSFDNTKGDFIDFIRVSPDSIRMYIKEDEKAVKGGFAIGSFDGSKAGQLQYLSVTPMRTNVQVKDTILGFSVTNVQSPTPADFMRIDKINAFIGHETGTKVTPSTLGDQGKYNVFLGYQSGANNTSGYRNVFMGYRAGMKNSTAENNVYIGTESGINNQTGNSNTFIGYRSGYSTTTSENTFVGHGSGYYNSSGKYNTFLGKGTGSFHDSGDYNLFVGWGAGNDNDSGAKNVFLGAGAGTTNTGSSNIFIGYNANVSGSNVLWINNGFSATPLISGNFQTRKVIINGKTGDFTDPGYEFYVVGDAGGSTAWGSLSD
ncbi:MAG: hypothetical protein GYA43_03840, partial [Bacteroidales bacterium]|nr:hypothetical protein [Bacteroidales bacterium]